MVTIEIRSGAFLEFIRSGWEKNRREAGGALFGHIRKTKNGLLYVVKTVHPSGRAEGKPTTFLLRGRYDNRCAWTVDKIEKYVGSYHVHNEHWNSDGWVQVSATLNPTDLKDFRENESPDLVTLVLAFNSINRWQRPVIHPTSISGTHQFQDQIERGNDYMDFEYKRFHISMRGYYLEKSTGKKGRLRRADLRVGEKTLEAVFQRQ